MILHFTCPGATLSHEMRVDASKTEEKLRFYLCWSNPFARNEGRSSKTEGKIVILHFTCPGATLSHEMRVDASKTGVKVAILLVPEQPFRTK